MKKEMSSLNNNQNDKMKVTNQMSIVNYDDDDDDDETENVAECQKRNSHDKPRSDESRNFRSNRYHHGMRRDDHNRQLYRSNDEDVDDDFRHKDNRRHNHHSSSSRHYKDDDYHHRSHSNLSSSSYSHKNSHHRSSYRSHNDRYRKKNESPEKFHRHSHSDRREESRHKHGGNCRKSKRDRSHHHHHRHHERDRSRSPKEPSLERHHQDQGDYSDGNRTYSQVEKEKCKESGKNPKMEPESHKVESKKSVTLQKSTQNIIEDVSKSSNDSKSREPPAAVLASVAAAVANLKAQKSAESVLNRLSLQNSAQQNSLATSSSTDIPKYYNTKMVNAAKLAQQAEKRKLLWGDNRSSSNEKSKIATISSTNVWTNLKFQGEHGQAMTEKFRKLMGIKTNNNDVDSKNMNIVAPNQKSSSSIKINDHDNESNNNDNDVQKQIVSNQEKLFEHLDQQYSIARRSTHLNRGVGLGFSGLSNSFQRAEND